MLTKKIITLLLVSVTIITLVSSCAPSTQMAGSWKNEEFKGDINKVLVLAIAKQTWSRKAFEYTLRDDFKAYGIEALATLDVISSEQKISKGTFNKFFKDKNIDAVVVSRVVGVDEKQTQVYNDMYVLPYGYYNGFHSFYFATYDYIYNPGYTVTNETVRIETNLYNAHDSSLIWSGISESLDPDDAFDLIDSVSKIIISELDNLGYIKK